MHHLPENQWHPVPESTELESRPLGVERFGQRLVFWRAADGKPHAHPDRCPHLGAAPSAGTIVSDRLVCPFHAHRVTLPVVSQAFELAMGWSNPFEYRKQLGCLPQRDVGG